MGRKYRQYTILTMSQDDAPPAKKTKKAERPVQVVGLAATRAKRTIRAPKPYDVSVAVAPAPQRGRKTKWVGWVIEGEDGEDKQDGEDKREEQ